MFWITGTIPDCLPTPCWIQCSFASSVEFIHYQTRAQHHYCMRIFFCNPALAAPLPSGRVRPSVRPQPLPAAMDRRCRLPLPPALPGSACCESPYMAAEEQAGCSIHRKEDRQWSLPVQRQRKAGGTLSYPGPSSRDMLNLWWSILLSWDHCILHMLYNMLYIACKIQCEFTLCAILHACCFMIDHWTLYSALYNIILIYSALYNIILNKHYITT